MKSVLTVGKDESRRASIFSGSEAGSEAEQRRKLRYGGPLAGIA